MHALLGTDLLPTEQHKSHAKPRIVIIEDDESALSSVVRLLRQSGYIAVPELRGASGAMTSLFEPTSLVLLDLGLPGVVGEEVLELLYYNAPDVPVVLVTGSAEARSIANSWPNVVGVFQKPYDSNLLLAMVEDLIGLA